MNRLLAIFPTPNSSSFYSYTRSNKLSCTWWAFFVLLRSISNHPLELVYRKSQVSEVENSKLPSLTMGSLQFYCLKSCTFYDADRLLTRVLKKIALGCYLTERLFQFLNIDLSVYYSRETKFALLDYLHNGNQSQDDFGRKTGKDAGRLFGKLFILRWRQRLWFRFVFLRAKLLPNRLRKAHKQD